jgi:uncharacterized membrane protein YkoI
MYTGRRKSPMRHLKIAILAALLMAGLSGRDASAAETRIRHDQLPPAVRKTADQQSQGAAVRGYSKETENGQLEYEIAMTVNGHSKDVSIALDGRVLEIEEQVSLDSLRPQARRGLEDRAQGAKITKIESLTKNGKIVAYEAQLAKGQKHSEIQVGPDGRPLNHEE